MTEKQRVTPVLVIDGEKSAGIGYREHYYHLHGWIAADPDGLTLPDYEQKEVAENGLLLGEYRLGPLKKIKLKNQSHTESLKERTYNGFYGFEYGMDGFVTDYEFSRVQPTLRKISRKLEKLAAVEGSTDDIALLIGRFARAIGAQRIATRNTPDQQRRSGQRFRLHSIADGIQAVRYIVHGWREEAVAA
jgi:hypothetical protein